MRLLKNISVIPEKERLDIARENYKEWYENKDLLESLKEQLLNIKDNDNELVSGFLTLIGFGTAGLRGKMKVGAANMNVPTVELTTQALAYVVLKNDGAKNGVAIACDSRNNSEVFSRAAACVLAANGIKVYKFDSLRPTPELSFAVRELGCKAGINITASHNPKDDNGYKVYWEDGAQLPPEEAKVVSDKCYEYNFFADVKHMEFEMAKREGLIVEIGSEMDEKYIKILLDHIIDPKVIKEFSNLNIIYTPLHGAGHFLVPETLRRAGFENVFTVSAQMIPDGNFPTVSRPNPQYNESYILAQELSLEIGGCDLIIATDPDADRVGICVPERAGGWFFPTGNQVGLLMLDYIITAKKRMGKLPKNACAVKSIVTTKLAEEICKKNDVAIKNVYTGFKYIGEKIKEFEKSGEYTFIFGFEESYGYLSGTYARDKDAIGGALLIAEMTAYYKQKDITLHEALEKIYEKYGFSAEFSQDVAISSMDIKGKMTEIMDKARALVDSNVSLGGLKIKYFGDYKTGIKKNLYDGRIEKLDFPPDEVVFYELDDSTTVIIRPSGTEPKFKIYYFVSADDYDNAKEKYQAIKESLSWIEE